MDWTLIGIGAGLMLAGWMITKIVIPWYVRMVPNNKVRALCRDAAKKADEYGDKKLGKSNFDALQNTLAATFGAAFVGACEGSGINPHVVINAIIAEPPLVPPDPHPPLTKPALVG